MPHQPLIIFSHGKESGPQATKIVAMQEVSESLSLESMSIDYRGLGTAAERCEKLLSIQAKIQKPVVLVGSSMGAYVSLLASQSMTDVEGLFLLAPAIGLPGYESEPLKKLTQPIEIIHGWQDEIVPATNVIEFAQNYQLNLTLVNDDHPLSHSVERVRIQFQTFLKGILASD